MTREAVAQLATLLVAEICEGGVLNDMVLGAEVVQALQLLDWDQVPGTCGVRELRIANCTVCADIPGRGGHNE